MWDADYICHDGEDVLIESIRETHQIRPWKRMWEKNVEDLVGGYLKSPIY